MHSDAWDRHQAAGLTYYGDVCPVWAVTGDLAHSVLQAWIRDQNIAILGVALFANTGSDKTPLDSHDHDPFLLRDMLTCEHG